MPEKSSWMIIDSRFRGFISSFDIKPSLKARSAVLLTSAFLLASCSQTETSHEKMTTSSSEAVTPKTVTQPAADPAPMTQSAPKELLYKDTLKGYATKEYLFSVSEGQHANINLHTNNLSNYFNVTHVGSESAIFIGSIRGAHFEQTFSAAGDYKVLVYLMRNAARRDETAQFELQIRLSGRLPPQQPEPLAVSRMHPSWDLDGDGINDCEKEGSCDHTVDYTQPRH